MSKKNVCKLLREVPDYYMENIKVYYLESGDFNTSMDDCSTVPMSEFRDLLDGELDADADSDKSSIAKLEFAIAGFNALDSMYTELNKWEEKTGVKPDYCNSFFETIYEPAMESLIGGVFECYKELIIEFIFYNQFM